MDHDIFIKKLARGLENIILAFDYTDDQRGCLVYLNSPRCKLLVPTELIDYRLEDAVQALRERIKSGVSSSPCEVLTDVDGKLVLRASDSCD